MKSNYLESMKFPAPLVLQLSLKLKADVDKMGMALAKLAEEIQRLLLEQMSLRANYYLRYG
jgi:translation elongation factor EF-G